MSASFPGAWCIGALLTIAQAWGVEASAAPHTPAASEDKAPETLQFSAHRPWELDLGLGLGASNIGLGGLIDLSFMYAWRRWSVGIEAGRMVGVSVFDTFRSGSIGPKLALRLPGGKSGGFVGSVSLGYASLPGGRAGGCATDPSCLFSGPLRYRRVHGLHAATEWGYLRYWNAVFAGVALRFDISSAFTPQETLYIGSFRGHFGVRF